MKLLTLEIPDDPALVPEWLESHLMGLDLHCVVAELAAMNGPAEEAATLAEILGDRAADVLTLGLRSLSREQLRRLLAHPHVFVDLQQFVLDEGGEYWLTVPEKAVTAGNSRKTWNNLQTAFRDESPKAELPQPPLPLRHPWLWAGAGWLTAAAVALFAIVIRGDHVRQLEGQVAEQTALVTDLKTKLQEQQALARVRFDPADLPGDFVQAAADPPDLPPDDPEDLPDWQ